MLSWLNQALQAGGAKDLPEKQRTMRSTLDWSNDLLSKAEKDLFARSSVFAEASRSKRPRRCVSGVASPGTGC